MVRGPLKHQALALLRERGVPIATILDVGVLTSTSELIVAFPDLKHILFEPIEEFSDAIKENYQSIEHELVTAAVSDKSGETSLQVFSIHGGMQISHSTMTTRTDGGGLRKVPMVSLDDYLARHPQQAPYLLKVDVDGAEMSVLAGAKETLGKCSVVIVEMPRYHLVERLTAMLAAGFDLFDIVEPCYYDNVLWQCDAIFVRSDILPKHFKRFSNTDFESAKYTTFRG